MSLGQYDVERLVADAVKSAYTGCGLSDVLFESRLQARFGEILDQAPAECRLDVEKALVKAGYDPEFRPYEAQEGECDLTGIDENWCPCGRHP